MELIGFQGDLSGVATGLKKCGNSGGCDGLVLHDESRATTRFRSQFCRNKIEFGLLTGFKRHSFLRYNPRVSAREILEECRIEEQGTYCGTVQSAE